MSKIKKMLLISMVILGASLGSCSSVRKIPGRYFGNNTYTSLLLNNDSTFSYRYKFEFFTAYSEGKWELSGNSSIKINSYIQNRLLPVQGYEKYNSSIFSCKHLTVNAGIPMDEKHLYKCSIYVNDTFLMQASCDSIGKLNIPIETKSVFVKISSDSRLPSRFLDSLETQKYIVKNSKCNELELDITYIDSFFNYRVFNNENIRIKRKGLKFSSPIDKRTLFLPRHN